MKRIFIPTLIVVLTLLLASCSGTADSASTTTTNSDVYVSANLPADYENALPVRNQLAIGTMKLDGTAQDVTPEQAKTLLPLYQALRSTTTSGASAQQEISALLSQIEGAMTSEQLTSIRDMQLTLTDMQTWAADNGITLGQNDMQPGARQGLSPEARATLQAANGKTGEPPGSGGSTAVMDAIISYLESVAQ
jgi:hypothetical protein